MTMNMRCLTVVAAALMAAAKLHAVPACPEPFTAEQSDGTKVNIHLRGDEFLNWNEDSEGFTVMQSEADGDWVYAQLSPDGTSLEPSPFKVAPPNANALRPTETKRLLPARQVQAASAAKAVQMSAIRANEASTLRKTGTIRQLVVLVEFSDVQFSKTRTEFDDLLNKTGYSGAGNAGSLKDFYREVSYGQLTVESTVVGPVRLQHPLSYYGRDLRPGDANYGRFREDSHQLGPDTLAALAATGFSSWSDFDIDGDGYFDELEIIHAGYGQEMGGSSSDNIWSCRWSWTGYFAKYGGIAFSGFHTEPELRGNGTGSSATDKQITQVGVICHEFGHSLGLPDLYDTDNSSEGLGEFCLMAGGSWGQCGSGDSGTCPAQMSAWCKVKLGWVTPTEITASGQYSLPRVEDNPKVYKLQGDFSSSNEYFLIENKTATGFDRGLPGSNKGLLVFHVDDSLSDNKNESHYMVDLEEASGTQHLELGGYGRGDDNDYFRSSTRSSFTSTTSPNNKSYSGTALGLDISGISAAGNTMTFTVSGGTPEPDPLPDVPVISVPTWGTSRANESYIEIRWAAVANATSYNIYRSESNARPSAAFARNVTSPYCDYSTAVNRLEPGKQYYYWVSAANAAGESYSESDWGNLIVSLTVNRSEIAFAAAGGSVSVTVQANSPWNFSTQGTGFSAEAFAVDNNGTVTVTAAKNEDDEIRTGSVKITAGSGTLFPVTKTVALTQAAAEPERPEFEIVDQVLVRYNGNGGCVEIPDEVRIIGPRVFRDNASVTSVVFPDGLESIGESAFCSCSALESVSFGANLEEIGYEAFAESGLRSVTLPASVLTIATGAFRDCHSLVCVEYLGAQAPEVEWDIYDQTPETLVSYVQPGSKGWNGDRESTTLPAKFPFNGGRSARAIQRRGKSPDVPELSISTRGDRAREDYIEISWTAVEDETYNIYRSTVTTRPEVPLASNVRPDYRDDVAVGLIPRTVYYYWVEAVTSLGSAFSDPEWGNILEKPDLPDAPTVVSAIGDAEGVSLEWRDAAGAESYRVYRSESPVQRGEVIADDEPGTSLFDDTCTPGVDYWYSVSAVNEAGETFSTALKAYRQVVLEADELVAVPADGGEVPLAVSANAAWEATTGCAWLDGLPVSSSGDETLTVAVGENDGEDVRQATVRIVAGPGTPHQATKVVTIVQDGAPKKPEPGSGVISNLSLRRYWPDADQWGSAEFSFDLDLADDADGVELEVRVIDDDYAVDVWSNVEEIDEARLYVWDRDEEDADWSSVWSDEALEVTSGAQKFKVDFAPEGGSRAIRVAVRVKDGEWVESESVRFVSNRNSVWANGREPYFDGTRTFVTNTAFLANGRYDRDLNPLGEEEDPEEGPTVFVFNSDRLAVEEGRIVSNTVWTSDRIHVLRGDVVIPTNVTLTIENGASVRRFDSDSVIHVKAGGAIRLQGASFEKWEGALDGPGNPLYFSASEFMEYDEDMDETLIWGVYGAHEDADGNEDLEFRYYYTQGEFIGELPTPPAEGDGVTFGGWYLADTEMRIGPDADFESIFPEDRDEPPYEAELVPKTVPSVPTGIYVIVSGAEFVDEEGFDEYVVGRDVIVRWNSIPNDRVSSYAIELFRDGDDPGEVVRDSVDQQDGTIKCVFRDLPESGFLGGERLFCRVYAETDSGVGAPAEFSFTLPLVLELSETETAVYGPEGGSLNVRVTANVTWEAESTVDWISVEPDVEYGSVAYEVGSTDSAYERTGLIRVTGGGETRILTVVQEGDSDLQTKVATPVIEPQDGTAFDEDEILVTISCDTPGATIRYTTDGSTPTGESEEYPADGFKIQKTTEVRAIAVKSGLEDSDVAVSRIMRIGGADGDTVEIDIGDEKKLQIPKTWFAEYYPEASAADYAEIALSETGKRATSYVWQDYVAGTDPTNRASVFKIQAFRVDNGTIDITWDPDKGDERTYILYGNTGLEPGGWEQTTKENAGSYNFFKVSVEMK